MKRTCLTHLAAGFITLIGLGANVPEDAVYPNIDRR